MQQNSILTKRKVKLWLSNQTENENFLNEAEYVIDARSLKRKARKRKSSTKPSPMHGINQRRMKRNKMVSKKKSAMDKRKRKVGSPPKSSPSFRPKSSSSPKFSQRHVKNLENWMNDDEWVCINLKKIVLPSLMGIKLRSVYVYKLFVIWPLN